ncbi:MAG: hypothetical protein J6L98_06775 [Bacteroidales bacterium]|nr:hypothetical protein [Bacteroidales bacterium]MBP3270368.1 hypothetical protein [Bacteroidales bacterium]
MRKLIVLAITLLVSAGAYAQNNGSSKSQDLFPSDLTTISGGKGELMRFHGTLIYSESSELLRSSDVTGEFWRKYKSASILQDYGRYLWSLGLSYMATDAVIGLIYRNSNYGPLKDPSMIIGAACALVGGAMDFGGWVRLGNLAKQYNSDPSVRKEYSLNIGPTSSGGFGLSLNF